MMNRNFKNDLKKSIEEFKKNQYGNTYYEKDQDGNFIINYNTLALFNLLRNAEPRNFEDQAVIKLLANLILIPGGIDLIFEAIMPHHSKQLPEQTSEQQLLEKICENLISQFEIKDDTKDKYAKKHEYLLQRFTEAILLANPVNVQNFLTIFTKQGLPNGLTRGELEDLVPLQKDIQEAIGGAAKIDPQIMRPDIKTMDPRIAFINARKSNKVGRLNDADRINYQAGEKPIPQYISQLLEQDRYVEKSVDRNRENKEDIAGVTNPPKKSTLKKSTAESRTGESMIERFFHAIMRLLGFKKNPMKVHVRFFRKDDHKNEHEDEPYGLFNDYTLDPSAGKLNHTNKSAHLVGVGISPAYTPEELKKILSEQKAPAKLILKKKNPITSLEAGSAGIEPKDASVQEDKKKKRVRFED